MREILEQLISKQNDNRYHARVEVLDDGERATLSDNFESFEAANQWVIAVEQGLEVAPNDTIPEPAASDMTPEDAERINGNVVVPTPPNGAESIPNGEQAGVSDDDLTAADTQPAPTDHNTSNEVTGTQDATEVAHNSSNTPPESETPEDGKDAKDSTSSK